MRPFGYCLVLTGLVSCFAQFSQASPPLNCRVIFESPETDLVGIAMYYSPAIVTESGQVAFANHVYIETQDLDVDSKRSGELHAVSHPRFGYPLPYGRSDLHQAGLDSIYAKYGPSVNRALLKVVERVESLLPLNRQMIYSVLRRAQNSDAVAAVAGYIRIFDGSIYKTVSGGRKFSNPALPLELILRALGKFTTAVDKLRRAGFKVYEIGKYLIPPENTPQEKKLARQSLMRFLRESTEKTGPRDLKNAYFFAHVVEELHAIAYKDDYGFEETDPALSFNLDPNEKILIVRGDKLLEKLSKF